MAVRVEKVTRALMHRSMRILDMEYKPSEIAEELGASKAQILRLISADAPARKDTNGRYWISGIPFVAWLKDAAPKKPTDKHIFADDECYCFNCRRMVHFRAYRKYHRTVFGTCPEGHRVARFITLKPKGKAGQNE